MARQKSLENELATLNSTIQAEKESLRAQAEQLKVRVPPPAVREQNCRRAFMRVPTRGACVQTSVTEAEADTATQRRRTLAVEKERNAERSQAAEELRQARKKLAELLQRYVRWPHQAPSPTNRGCYGNSIHGGHGGRGCRLAQSERASAEQGEPFPGFH